MPTSYAYVPLFADSFDGYATAHLPLHYRQVFGAPTIETGTGARNGNYLRCHGGGEGVEAPTDFVGSNYPGESARSDNDHITKPAAGFALRIPTFTSVDHLVIAEYWHVPGASGIGAEERVNRLWLYQDGSLAVCLGTTAVLTTAPGVFNFGQWCQVGYLASLTYDFATWGAVQVATDGVIRSTVASVNVAETFPTYSRPTTNLFRVGNLVADNSVVVDVDDVHVGGSVGSTGTHDTVMVPYLGNVTVTWHPTTGPGDFTQLTVTGAATNWQAVRDLAGPDGDTSYVRLAFNQHGSDTYALGPYVGPPVILDHVMSVITTREVTPGINGFFVVVSSGGSLGVQLGVSNFTLHGGGPGTPAIGYRSLVIGSNRSMLGFPTNPFGVGRPTLNGGEYLITQFGLEVVGILAPPVAGRARQWSLE
jgi:hypothetical protein